VTRLAAWLGAGLLLAVATPAAAQTRAWLDRPQVTYGETTTLNIETDLAVQQVDYAPLRRQFDLAGQTVRRRFEVANGRSRTRSTFAVGIRPRGPGVLTVPSLQVGNTTTEPLRLTVLPPTVAPATGNADAFVETAVDAPTPYVQQSVGVVVRLHYAVPLLSGQLDQDAPANASLQRVGEDVTYQRELGGRRYNVVERRFLLLPERSGAMVLPGARFNGQAAGGFFDDIFGNGRKPLSAAAPIQRLQVLPIPADAPQPWLPLRDLRLRYLQAPTEARVGAASTLELELVADGASAAQLPTLVFPDPGDAQVFAEPVRADEQFVDGRPRTVLRQRVAIVPLVAGPLALAGPRVEWWDAGQGVARAARLPPLVLQVAAGSLPATSRAPDPGSTLPAAELAQPAAPQARRLAPWAGVLLALAALAWWQRRHVPAQSVPTPPRGPAHAQPAAPPSLASALAGGELPAIASALAHAAGTHGTTLEAVAARLDDEAQRLAVAALQAARWGDGDPGAALAQLRAAFARGPRWRRGTATRRIALPPLYPGR
jgi:hypothetical protein